MVQYFYIAQFSYDLTQTFLIRVMGYNTDVAHTLFFPETGYFQEEVIQMLKVKDVVFLYDGCYHRVYVKLVKTEKGEFLRVDFQTQPSDYMG